MLSFLQSELGLKQKIIVMTSTRLLFIWLFCISTMTFADESKDPKIKCAELGRKFSTEFKKEYASDIYTIWGNPEFHYSSTLDTCLVYTEIINGLVEKSASYVEYYRRITDIYSNKVIAYSRYFIDKKTKNEKSIDLINVGDATNLPSQIFARKKAELWKQ